MNSGSLSWSTSFFSLLFPPTLKLRRERRASWWVPGQGQIVVRSNKSDYKLCQKQANYKLIWKRRIPLSRNYLASNKCNLTQQNESEPIDQTKRTCLFTTIQKGNSEDVLLFVSKCKTVISLFLYYFHLSWLIKFLL